MCLCSPTQIHLRKSFQHDYVYLPLSLHLTQLNPFTDKRRSSTHTPTTQLVISVEHNKTRAANMCGHTGKHTLSARVTQLKLKRRQHRKCWKLQILGSKNQCLSLVERSIKHWIHLLSFTTACNSKFQSFQANLLLRCQTWQFWLYSRSSWAETQDSCSSQLQDGHNKKKKTMREISHVQENTQTWSH